MLTCAPSLSAQDAATWRTRLAEVTAATLLAEGGAAGRELFVLLQSDDEELRHTALTLCAECPDLLYPPHSVPDASNADPLVLAAFASGSRDVRDGLGGLLRMRSAWPLALASRLLRFEPRASLLKTPDHPGMNCSLASLARFELSRSERLAERGWLRALFEQQPAIAVDLLRNLPGPPPPELEPGLLRMLGNRQERNPALLQLMARTEAGCRALLARARNGPYDVLDAVASAHADPLPFLPIVEQVLRSQLPNSLQTAASPPPWISREVVAFVARLPWTSQRPELDPVRDLVQKLWRETWPERRTNLLPLLAACGPAATFAGDDVAAMLGPTFQQTDSRAAEALLAMGRADVVAAAFAGREWPRGGRGSHLDTEWNRREFEACLEATNRAFLYMLRALPNRAALEPSQRSQLAGRLLANLEATDNHDGARHFAFELGGPFDASIDPAFTAFFARRAAAASRPDLLAESIVHWTFRSLPDLCVTAIRSGLVPARAALEASRRSPLDSRRLASALPGLFAIAMADPRPDFAYHLGLWLAETGLTPLDTLLPGLSGHATRGATLQVLCGLGQPAAAAIDAVRPLLNDADAALRSVAATTLIRLGERGVALVVAAAAAEPALRFTIIANLASADGAALAAIAEWFVPQRIAWNPWERECLRIALDRARDGQARGWLGVLQHDLGVAMTDRDWLQLALVEPAPMRARLVQQFATPTPLAPLPLGVLAEFLFDQDPGVRGAAVDALLAHPQRTETCRRALEECAARAQPPAAVRIRSALAAPR